MAHKRFTLSSFKKVSDVGTDPRWPQYTGTTTWSTHAKPFSTGHYTIEVERLGGITARTIYKLYRGKKHLGSEEGMAFSLRKWVAGHMEQFGDTLKEEARPARA